MSGLTIEQYSEKAIVVRGEKTQEYKDSLKDLGGKFNNSLKGGCGWIYPNSKRGKIEELQQQIIGGSVKGVSVEKKTYEKKTSSSSSGSNGNVDEKSFVSVKSYLDLLARVEKLEAICSNVDFVKGTVKTSQKSENGGAEIEIEDSDEEESPKVERLLKRKPAKK